MRKRILRKKIFYIVGIAMALFACNKPEVIEVKSPDGEKLITIYTGSEQTGIGNVTFSVKFKGRDIVLPSSLEIKAKDINFRESFTIAKIEESRVKNEWASNFGERSIIPDNYKEIKLHLESSKAKLNLICRAYNEGVAFAYEIPEQNNLNEVEIDNELIRWHFGEDYKVWSTPKREPRKLTAQGEYRKIPLSDLEVGCERPLLVEVADDIKIAIAEARLVDYARISFDSGKEGQNVIVSSLDGQIKHTKQDLVSGAVENVRSEGPRIRMKLPFRSPWRVIMIGDSYGQLLENNYIIQNLNDPSEIEDESWITPGKVLREGTLTTKGGLAAIDFVASHNMQYVHFDAGWYGNEMDNASDASTVSLDPKRSRGPFDMDTLTAYAREKGVKVMLYVNRRALEKQLDDILPLFQEWGIAGIKYGFVRVGDQNATSWMHEAVKKTAKHNMIVNVHDEYRPTGFSRTYPNLLTQEGIRGDEETVPNSHTLITMFTRALAGASDNTVCYYNKRVEIMGSHASQLAKTVCIFSPLQYLYWYDKAPDAPVKDDALWGNTNTIGNEPELEFFNNVPTVWDETKVLRAEIGEIGVIARRKGNDWWIGGINGETARKVNIDFSFLKAGTNYITKIYTDDEAVKTRTRVKIEEKELDSSSMMKLNLKANNGFVMHIQQF